MLVWEPDDELFYKFAMELFSEAGHTSTSDPEFINHTPEQFVYFDAATQAILSTDQRNSLKCFANISRLFTVQNCAFFSITLSVSKHSRSQTAHDVHMVLHPLTGADASICFFKLDDDVLLSFVGYQKKCILSDWYSAFSDIDTLLDRIDIANTTVNNEKEFFFDLIYSTARSYYLTDPDLPIFELIPIKIFVGDDIPSREEVNELIIEQRLSICKEYGNDYVEYDDSVAHPTEDIGAELELMLLDIDDIEDDNPFGEEYDDDDEREDDDEYITQDNDEYEFEDVDPAIFSDPILLVKWLEKTESKDNNSEG